MSLRKYRQSFHLILVIFLTLVGKQAYDYWNQQHQTRLLLDEIISLCQLPEIGDELIINHAIIDYSTESDCADAHFILTGPSKTLDAWLSKIDEWKAKQPGAILNYQIRESEMRSRVDFSAEVYLPKKP